MEKIWVIEDDESIRGELQKLLRANGYQPVEGQPCDLVLLDINLPGENGFEICQKIRRGASASPAEILLPGNCCFYSAAAFRKTENQCSDGRDSGAASFTGAGGHGYFFCPVRLLRRDSGEKFSLCGVGNT